MTPTSPLPSSLPPDQNMTTTVETIEWFDSLPSPDNLPHKRRHIRTIVIVSALLICLVSGGIILFASQRSSACLTTRDLQHLLGRTDIDPVTSPTTYFFSYPVVFQINSVEYDQTARTTGSTVIRQLSDFYASHKNSSIVFTLSGDFFQMSDANLVARRMETIQRDLIATGIPRQAIVSENPVLDEPEDGDTRSTVVTISISSALSCRSTP